MRIPQPLIDDIHSGRCLPFIGAGFSMNAKLPGDRKMPAWSDLASSLAKSAGLTTVPEGPDAATAFERKYGRVHLVEAIRQLLHPSDAVPGAAHVAFAHLPFDTIYTTNFDLLLEDALQAVRRPFRSLVGELQMPFHGGRDIASIVKMHGDLRHEEHLIVSRSDYNTFLSDYPVIATHLAAMLIVRTALFIGYSRSDPDFMQIQEVVKSRLGKFQRRPFVVQFDCNDTDIEHGFNNDLYIVSLQTSDSCNRDQALQHFFEEIRQQLDLRSGGEIRASRPEAFEQVSGDTFKKTYSEPDSSHLYASTSTICFVMMPFGSQFDLVYNRLLSPVASNAGLTPIRADDIHIEGTLTESVRAAIQQSRLCVADVSDSNPNVLYELGIAQSLGKKTILIARRGSQLPVDISAHTIMLYDVSSDDTTSSSRLRFEKIIRIELIDQLRIEAEQLIFSGHARAGVALLGVLLEHALLFLDSPQGLTEEDPRSQRRGTTLHSLQRLRSSGEVDQLEFNALRSFLNVRNRAVHELKEPTAQEAETAFAVVSAFVQRCLFGDAPNVTP